MGYCFHFQVHYFKNDLGIDPSRYFTRYSSTLSPAVANAVGSSVIGFLSTMFPLNITVNNQVNKTKFPPAFLFFYNQFNELMLSTLLAPIIHIYHRRFNFSSVLLEEGSLAIEKCSENSARIF